MAPLFGLSVAYPADVWRGDRQPFDAVAETGPLQPRSRECPEVSSVCAGTAELNSYAHGYRIHTTELDHQSACARLSFDKLTREIVQQATNASLDRLDPCRRSIESTLGTRHRNRPHMLDQLHHIASCLAEPVQEFVAETRWEGRTRKIYDLTDRLDTKFVECQRHDRRNPKSLNRERRNRLAQITP